MSKKPKKEESLSLEAREAKRIRDETLAVLQDTGIVLGGCAGATAPHTRVGLLHAENCVKSVLKKRSGEPEDAWSLGPPLQEPRYCCSAVSLCSGKLLVVGGFDNMGLPLDSTEIVDLLDGKTLPGPRLQMPRAGCAAVALPLPVKQPKVTGEEEEDKRKGSKTRPSSKEGKEKDKPFIPWVLVLGGYGPDAAMTSEVLDLEAMTSCTGPKLLAPRSCFGATMYDGRRVMIIGGFDDKASVKTMELLDLHTLKPLHVAEPDFGEEVIENEQKTSGEKPVSRQSEKPTTKQDEEAGQAKEGEDDDEDENAVFNGSADQKPVYDEEEEELFEEEKPFTGPLIAEDVARARFLPGPSMLECRANFGLVFMPEDEGNKTPARHLVLGGLDERGRRLQTTEWLDVMRIDEEEEEEEEQKEVAPQPVEADDNGFGFAGEEEDEPPPVEETESEEEEEPEKEFGFEPGPPLLTGRSGLGAVRLSSVIVLCAGGVGEDGKSTESTEYYNNETGEFKPGPPLGWIGKEREEGQTGGFGFCAATRVL